MIREFDMGLEERGPSGLPSGVVAIVAAAEGTDLCRSQRSLLLGPTRSQTYRGPVWVAERSLWPRPDTA